MLNLCLKNEWPLMRDDEFVFVPVSYRNYLSRLHISTNLCIIYVHTSVLYTTLSTVVNTNLFLTLTTYQITFSPCLSMIHFKPNTCDKYLQIASSPSEYLQIECIFLPTPDVVMTARQWGTLERTSRAAFGQRAVGQVNFTNSGSTERRIRSGDIFVKQSGVICSVLSEIRTRFIMPA